jgi:hypothetical protein
MGKTEAEYIQYPLLGPRLGSRKTRIKARAVWSWVQFSRVLLGDGRDSEPLFVVGAGWCRVYLWPSLCRDPRGSGRCKISCFEATDTDVQGVGTRSCCQVRQRLLNRPLHCFSPQGKEMNSYLSR